MQWHWQVVGSRCVEPIRSMARLSSAPSHDSWSRHPEGLQERFGPARMVWPTTRVHHTWTFACQAEFSDREHLHLNCFGLIRPEYTIQAVQHCMSSGIPHPSFHLCAQSFSCFWSVHRFGGRVSGQLAPPCRVQTASNHCQINEYMLV